MVCPPKQTNAQDEKVCAHGGKTDVKGISGATVRYGGIAPTELSTIEILFIHFEISHTLGSHTVVQVNSPTTTHIDDILAHVFDLSKTRLYSKALQIMTRFFLCRYVLSL